MLNFECSLGCLPISPVTSWRRLHVYMYPRATPPGRPFGSGHTAVSRPAPAWSRRSMLTSTCRIFRRPQRPKDDAVVNCPCRYRRLSGPLRFPRYHVHPKRRQSLLARVPGLSWCLLVYNGRIPLITKKLGSTALRSGLARGPPIFAHFYRCA